MAQHIRFDEPHRGDDSDNGAQREQIGPAAEQLSAEELLEMDQMDAACSASADASRERDSRTAKEVIGAVCLSVVIAVTAMVMMRRDRQAYGERAEKRHSAMSERMKEKERPQHATKEKTATHPTMDEIQFR